MQQEEPDFTNLTNEKMHRKMDKIEALYQETQAAWAALGGYNTIADLIDEEEEDTPHDLTRSTAEASLDIKWEDENKFVYRA